MSYNTYKVTALIMWIFLAILMQVHAIAYWFETIGSIGVAISIALEMVALWHWWHRNIVLGVIVSMLLVSGPLFHVALPMAKTLQEQSAIQEQLEQHKRLLEQDQKSLDKLLQTNWAGMLDKQLERQQKHQISYNSLLSSTMQHVSLEYYLSIIMHALALLIMLFTQIHILNLLRENSVRLPEQNINNFNHSNTFQEPSQPFQKNETLFEMATEIFQKLDAYRVSTGITWKEIADRLNVPASVLTRIKKLAEGHEESVSMDRLREVHIRLNERI